MQKNFYLILSKKTQHVSPKNLVLKVNLKAGSHSKRIIEFLFNFGPTSGKDLIAALNLRASPQQYIQPHIKTGRIVCKRVNFHKSIYSINSELNKDFFGL